MLMERKWEDTDIISEHTSIAAWHGSDLKVHVVLYMALLKNHELKKQNSINIRVIK